MPDIAMCQNKECFLKLKCQRYMAKPDGWQSYADFKVTAVGQAPFPAQGSVVVESIIEAPMMTPQGYDGGN